MAAKLGGGDEDIITDINITPFVDIILVVLIIFMVTATYIVSPSIKVNLPEAATGEPTETSSLGLTLTEAGELLLDGEPIEEAALRAFIGEEIARADGDVTCLIAADEGVDHGRVVWLIALVKQEGVKKFAINIDPAVVKAYQSGPGAAPGPPPPGG